MIFYHVRSWSVIVFRNGRSLALSNLYENVLSDPGEGGGGGGVRLGILGRGVPPGSPNPDPISDQNIPFFTPVFRPGL